MNKLPNFLLVGAPKCGTTSMHKYLNQHPDIYLSGRKEPLFMVSEIYKDLTHKDPRRYIAERITILAWEDYKKLFSNVEKETAVGESSQPYLYYHNTAIPKIKKYLGDVNILISLRNPVDRAYSCYSHLFRDGVVKTDFETFIDTEPERKKETWDILNYPVGGSLYYDQVKAYMDNFSHVKTVLTEDLHLEPVKTIQEVCEFLGVDASFVPETKKRYNTSAVPKYRLLKDLLQEDSLIKETIKNTIFRFLSEKKRSNIKSYFRDKNRKQMKNETRQSLKKIFQPDILKLQDIIDRDLSHWL